LNSVFESFTSNCNENFVFLLKKHLNPMKEKYIFSPAHEPSEELLMLIMKEVAEEAKNKAALTEKRFNEYLHQLILDTISKYNLTNEKGQ